MMSKKHLTDLLNDTLLPLGFKKKGNYWLINRDPITKMVNLQKSDYSDAFYINYGYIITSLPLNDFRMHVYNRVTSADAEERVKISDLLNLENDIADDLRAKKLKEILQTKLVEKLNSIATEKDLSLELKSRPHLNNITLAVKQHLNLE